MESRDFESDLTETLGSGSYSSVYLGHSKKDTNIKVAVKEIKNDSKQKGQFSESAKKEFFAMWKACDHINIMKLLDFHSTIRFIYIIMDFCELGDLESYTKRRNLPMKQKLDIMMQCANGVTYLHNMEPPIIHRDLKPQNILIKETASGDIVKISDFGLSKVLEENKQQYMSTDAGTPKFRAPELFKQGRLQYTSAVDVFALGLVYLVLLKFDKNDPSATFEPYDNPNEPFLVYGVKLLLCHQNNQPFPTLFELTSELDKNIFVADIKILICKMVAYEFSNRPKMEIVMKELEIIVNKSLGHLPVAYHDYNTRMEAKESAITKLEEENTELKRFQRTANSNTVEFQQKVTSQQKALLEKDKEIDLLQLQLISTTKNFEEKDEEIAALRLQLTKIAEKDRLIAEIDRKRKFETNTSSEKVMPDDESSSGSQKVVRKITSSGTGHNKMLQSGEGRSTTYKLLCQKTFQVKRQLNLQNVCVTMRINDNKLFCTVKDSLYVYSVDGDLLSTVKFNYGGKGACSTVSVNSHQFIVADEYKGVFLLNKDGDCVKQLCQGSFSDLHQYQGKVYGLQCEQGQVVVFELQRQTWSKSHTITLKGYTRGGDNDRLCVNNNNIYTSPCHKHCLQIYDMKGRLLSTYGEEGLYQSGGVKAGLLCYPFLCDVDNSGTALIADNYNQRLQTCTTTGEWQVITLPQDVVWPTYAVVNYEDQSIWVVSNYRTLFKLTK